MFLLDKIIFSMETTVTVSFWETAGVGQMFDDSKMVQWDDYSQPVLKELL